MYTILRVRQKAVGCILAACLLLLCAAVLLPRLAESRPAMAQNSKLVCLTFDDGPSKHTDGVLDVLAKHGVPATFFVTGQSPDHASCIARAHAEGHQIALHTWSHDFSEIYSSADAFWADIDRIAQLVQQQTGTAPAWLRFAGGSSNTVCTRFGGRGFMKTLVAQCTERGYVYLDWNVDTKDAVGGTSTAEDIARRALKGIRAQTDCAVVLMHDGQGNSTCAAALDILIPQLLDEGYTFVRADALPSPVHHTLN